ncbi:MAG TPA: Lpg1974 family pore-forming outer membrane protein [Pirellulales bacterium]
MPFRTASWLLLLAVGLSLSTPQAYAQSADDSDIQRRLAELERQVATMQSPARSRLTSRFGDQPPVLAPEPTDKLTDEIADSTISPDGALNDSCNRWCLPDCSTRPALVGQDFLNTGCRQCGVVFGSELLFLKPTATNGDLPGATANVNTNLGLLPPTAIVNFNVHNSFTFETAPRFWLGYVTKSGLGFRVQYWEFRHSSDTEFLDPVGLVAFGGAMRFRTFDWEVTQQIDFRRWRMLAFGGFRYGEIRQSESLNVLGTLATLQQSQAFNGIGLTGGVNLNRSLFNSKSFTWYTNTRGSILFGDRSYNYQAGADILFPVSATANYKLSGETLGILEIATGPQWQKQLARGGQFFVRGGFEGQLWLNAGTIDNTPYDSALGNIGFGGFSVATGIIR